MAKRALIIGISNYVQCDKIPSCDNDANDLKHVLTTTKEYGYSQGDIVLMTSQSKGNLYPSKANIERQIARLFRGASSDDTVLLFFSGHGANVNNIQYLCPMDCSPANISGTLIPLSFVKDELNNSSAKVKLILLDACHSGENSRGLKGALRGINPEILSDELKETEGSVIFGSCKSDEVSYAPSNMRNSLWASEIISVLNNPKAIINEEKFLLLSDLADHVTIRVKAYSRDHFESVQSPVLYSNCSGPIIIGDFRPKFSAAENNEELLKSSEIIAVQECIYDVKELLGAENMIWDPSTAPRDELYENLETKINDERNSFLKSMRTSIRTEGLAQRSEINENGEQIEFSRGTVGFEANLIENQRKLQFQKIIKLNQNQSENFDSFMKICYANLDELTYIEFKLEKLINIDECLDLFERAGGNVTAEDENEFEGTYKNFEIIVYNDDYTGRSSVKCKLNQMYRVKRFFEQGIFSELAQIVDMSVTNK